MEALQDRCRWRRRIDGEEERKSEAERIWQWEDGNVLCPVKYQLSARGDRGWRLARLVLVASLAS